MENVAWKAVLHPIVRLEPVEAVPVPTHVGHVAPLCSDKALGTRKKATLLTSMSSASRKLS